MVAKRTNPVVLVFTKHDRIHNTINTLFSEILTSMGQLSLISWPFIARLTISCRKEYSSGTLSWPNRGEFHVYSSHRHWNIFCTLCLDQLLQVGAWISSYLLDKKKTMGLNFSGSLDRARHPERYPEKEKGPTFDTVWYPCGTISTHLHHSRSIDVRISRGSKSKR